MKYTDEEKKRARGADLIYIPTGLSERCSNCKFITATGYCKHPRVKLQIESPSQECCGLWDNSSIDRSKTQG